MRVATDFPIPEPAPHEVRVRVVVAGVNRPDVLQRLGAYPPPADASPHLGLEVAGLVDGIGASVSGVSLQQPVCALVAGGGYAEYVCVPACLLMRVPSGLSLLDAAALPETCMTVWANVFERGALMPGEVFLVTGGASSIGLTAIAMAKAHGATVLAIASDEAKRSACLAQGADAVFDYRTAQWSDEIAAWLKHQGRAGVDVALDMVGGATLNALLGLMATEGRLLSIAQLDGASVNVDASRLMLKRLTLTGSTLRARTLAYKAHLAEVLQARVWPQLDREQWRPVVHAVLPLDHVQKAHLLLERRVNIGKVLLAC